MNHNPRFTPLSAALLLALSATARGDQAPADVLDRVQVTANRYSQSEQQAIASVTVLDRNDIEESAAPDLFALLGRQVGVVTVRTGGIGGQNSVFVRGGNSNQTLVLIDGVRVNSSTQGLFDFAHLPLANIERIEIVRGPRAFIWGSDAISGVIQIFTRAPQGGFAELQAGSYGLKGLDAGYGAADGGNSFGFSAGGVQADGFSATNPGNVWNYDPDDDGYENSHLNLNAGTMLGNQTLRFSGILTDAETEFDQGVSDARNYSWSASMAGALLENWQHTLALGQANETIDTPAYANTFGSNRYSADWNNTLTVQGGLTAGFGINWSNESGYSDSYGAREFGESRRNTGVYANLGGSFGEQRFELASRYDDNAQFGGVSTSSAAWAWQPSESQQLRASWGQGFRAPNFNELYYPGFFGAFAGNPDLEPERSWSAEIGYSQQWRDRYQVRLSAFRSDIDDLIAFAGVDYQAININKAEITGVEAELEAETGAWQWRVQGAWTRALDAATDSQLLRRPELAGLLGLGYRFDNQFNLAAEFSAVGKRPDFGGNLPGYTRLDLIAGWPVNANWRIEGRLENLLNRDYELIDGYNTPGRSVFLRINYLGD